MILWLWGGEMFRPINKPIYWTASWKRRHSGWRWIRWLQNSWTTTNVPNPQKMYYCHLTNKWYDMIHIWRIHIIISSFPVLSSTAKETLPRLNQHPQAPTKPANKPAATVLPADTVFPVFFKNKAKGFVAFCTRPRALARCNIVGFRRFLLDTFPLTTLEAAFVCFFDFWRHCVNPKLCLFFITEIGKTGPRRLWSNWRREIWWKLSFGCLLLLML